MVLQHGSEIERSIDKNHRTSIDDGAHKHKTIGNNGKKAPYKPEALTVALNVRKNIPVLVRSNELKYTHIRYVLQG